MKIFISSVIRSMESDRDAAARAIRALAHEPIRAEDFGASPATPQQTCLQGVRSADLVVVLLGTRYGDLQPSGLSATHEEYREAQERKPVLAFVLRTDAREPKQAELVSEVQAWQSGQYTAGYTDPDELVDSVVRALRDYEVNSTAGTVDVTTLLREVESLVPTSDMVREGSLCVAVVGGPSQQVLRPRELESQPLAETISKLALFGPQKVFELSSGTSTRLSAGRLTVEQDRARVIVSETGAVSVTQPLAEDPRSSFGFTIIEEDLAARIRAAMAFVSSLLDEIDPQARLTDIVLCSALLDVAYRGWMTRAEHAASPNSWPTGSGEQRTLAYLSPPSRKRAAIRHDIERIVDDLVVLLRRERKKA